MPNLKPHPEFDAVLEIVRSLSLCQSKFRGHGYRCVDAKFAHDLLSGKGSFLHGGRWNAPGSLPAVYLANSPEAALSEYFAWSRRTRVPDYKALPMVMVAVKIKISRVLNLGLPEVSVALGGLLQSETIHWRSIQNRREAISQAIGRAAQMTGFQGLQAPSQQAPDAVTMVLFPDHLAPEDEVGAPRFQPITWT
jgi:RES domain-containing protein